MNGEIIYLNENINLKNVIEKQVFLKNKIYKLRFIETSIKKEDNSIIKVLMLLNFLDDKDYPENRKIISDCLIKLSIEDTNNKERFSDSKYYNALQVRFGYSITCHKAQGNEFKSVILEYKEPITNFDLKWLYTAVTRAKEKLYIICKEENNYKKIQKLILKKR